MDQSAPITQKVLADTLNEVLADFRLNLNKDLEKFATKEDLRQDLAQVEANLKQDLAQS